MEISDISTMEDIRLWLKEQEDEKARAMRLLLYDEFMGAYSR